MLQPKSLFEERINSLLKNKEDIQAFWEIVRTYLKPSIRCNTLKISPEQLKNKLESLGWKLEQPFKEYPEIMKVTNQLLPGELGKTTEHLLGYYYVQELSSMMPILALKPEPQETLLDLCAAPGSKTTQASATMQNTGTIIANDPNLGRISILSANLGKIGASNTIITRHDGVILCNKLKKIGMKFDKILVDAPCSGEGNIRSNPKTFKIWNLKVIKKLSRLQKKLASSALELLKTGGELLYSTCTHAPEENELVLQHLMDNFNIEIQPIVLPKELKTRQGITSWNNIKFNNEIKNACRIYPQDNNTEGFFLAKIKKNG